jgi:hypothetical protein
VTPGLLAYHFGGKEQMLEAAYGTCPTRLPMPGTWHWQTPATIHKRGSEPSWEPGFDRHSSMLSKGRRGWSCGAWLRRSQKLHAVHADLYRRYRTQLTAMIEPLGVDGRVDAHLVFAAGGLGMIPNPPRQQRSSCWCRAHGSL